MTRVIVAHSEAMAAIAHRVVVMEGGQVAARALPVSRNDISASVGPRPDGAQELDPSHGGAGKEPHCTE